MGMAGGSSVPAVAAGLVAARMRRPRPRLNPLSQVPSLARVLLHRLAGEGGDEVGEVADLGQPQAVQRGRGAAAAGDAAGQHGGGEAELLRLPQAALGMRHLADLAGEADLAEVDRLGVGRPVGRGGDQGGGDGEVGGGLVDAEAAGDVEVDVVGPERQAAAGFEHRQQHRQPAAVPAHHLPARAAAGGGGEQRLDLDQHRPRALDPGEDRRAGDVAAALGEEQGGGVGDLDQAALGHLEDADLVGRAVAVLHRAQDAELVAAVAFEIERRIDHVLQHPGAGERALLGDVADQHQGEAAGLGEADQLGGAGADLGDGAGGAVERIQPHGLDGIDDDEREPPPPAPGWRRCRAAPSRRRAPRGAFSRPRRSARRRTCSIASSPLTYRARWPAAAMRAAACSRMVDLPMPGSPPTSTAEAGTMPPPSTRSSSARPVGMRAGGAEEPCRPTNSTRRPPPSLAAGPGPRTGAAASSCRVFHSPQASQRPCHFGWTPPQAWQT